ncbi:MAG: sulfide/dihydroorotate dehydrogenase-like FAD/NAD-binding protein [Candidatus Omnitrophota bacterium]
MFKILDKYELAPKIHYCLIEAPLIAKKANAGQFVVIRLDEKGERIPLTIADFDGEKGVITLVFQELGKTTSMFAKMKKGEYILDLLGPQGNPSEIKNFGNVVIIGGGIGIAPVYLLAKTLRGLKNHVTAILGYRSKEFIFWQDKMQLVSDRLLISTNDGSFGKKGFVTDVLRGIIGSNDKIDKVFAIGPAEMMRAVAELTKTKNISTIVSLNSLMVCSMGMCGACRVTVGKKTKFTCMDGPDFDANEIDFDELIKRLNTYKNEECSCK